MGHPPDSSTVPPCRPAVWTDHATLSAQASKGGTAGRGARNSGGRRVEIDPAPRSAQRENQALPHAENKNTEENGAEIIHPLPPATHYCVQRRLCASSVVAREPRPSLLFAGASLLPQTCIMYCGYVACSFRFQPQIGYQAKGVRERDKDKVTVRDERDVCIEGMVSKVRSKPNM